MKRCLLICGLLALTTACDKNKGGDDANPPDPTVAAATAGGADDGAPDEPFVPDVPQDPDPPQIAAGFKTYLNGEPQQVIDALQPVYEDLKERKQYRASGLAAGLLALAHAEVVFENAEEPSAHANEMAELTKDPEVISIAKIARGSVLLEGKDYTAAAEAFGAAHDAAPDTVEAALADIFQAKALINTAFGHSGSTNVEKPEDLEKAKAAYADAAKIAAGTDVENALLGHVEEGLAAIAEYQKKRDDQCKHSLAAAAYYDKSGAAALAAHLRGKAKDLKCDKPS